MNPRQPIPPRWQAAARTHTGNVRKLNEDAFLDRSDIGHWAVADGMGGHTGGDVASQRVVEALASLPLATDLADFVDQLEDRLLAVNAELLQLAGNSGRIIGTTVAGLVLHQHAFLLYWVGDSRIYLYRDGRLRQQSIDHTYTQELVDQGKLLPEQVKQHPENNVITRAVGAAPQLYVDMDLRNLQPGDRFLICSDGLDKELDEAEIERLMASGDLDTQADRMLALALARGGRDNVTLILINTDAAEGGSGLA